MNTLQKIKASKKITFSAILTIILAVYDLISVNAEILGIQGETLTIISLVITTISLVYDKFYDSEDVFKKLGITQKIIEWF